MVVACSFVLDVIHGTGLQNRLSSLTIWVMLKVWELDDVLLFTDMDADGTCGRWPKYETSEGPFHEY